MLFTTAVDIINTPAAAQSAGKLKREFHRYLKPAVKRSGVLACAEKQGSSYCLFGPAGYERIRGG